MTTSTRRGLGLIGVSLLLGVAGDALLRHTPWGLNVPLWLGLAVAGGWALLPAEPGPRRLSGWPIAVAMVFASFAILRDSGFLLFWNTMAILAALTLPILEARGVRLGLARVTDYARGALGTAAHAARGLLAPLGRDIAWGELGRFRQSAGGVAIGAGLAIPTVLVFGALLVGADAGFANLASRVIRFDPETLVSHAFLTGALTWLTAGYLSPLVSDAPPAGAPVRPAGPRLGIVEVAIPLAALGVLFLAFLGLQLGYLFGGEAAMRAAGLTYAEYARDGFVELVTASALVLPTLLCAHWLFAPATPGHRRAFTLLAGGIIGLVGLLMVSALHRVALYVGQYGLTEIRLYGGVFLGWVGFVHVVFLTTVLRGAPQRFAFRSVVSGLAVLGLLNLSNPEALIARSQIGRIADGAELDVNYLVSLSADAAPVIAAHMPGFTARAACDLYHRAFAARRAADRGDWRGFNVARWRAARAADAPAVTVWAPCPPPWARQPGLVTTPRSSSPPAPPRTD